MADADFEDDLFADLYEDDAKPEPTKTETTSAPPVVNGSTAVKTEEAIKSEPGAADLDNTKAEEEEEDDDDIDINLGGNSDHQAPAQQNHHEDHGYSRGPPGGHKDDGKMFIGGLNWETTDESLKDYFSQFGEVLECTVMRDGASGRSRGFGFLTFKDARTVNVVMVKEHYLDGKIIDPKRAIPRDEQERTSKIFVGGVSQEASEGDFKEYFMQFGRVVDATLMMDKDTGRPRGFGFVTFDAEEAVERCLSMPLEILGKAIEVKKAQPRGNVRDEEGPHHGAGAKFRGGDNHNGGGGGYGNPNQQAMVGMGGMAGMTPQVMAQYWQRMQQYMAMMQQQQMQMQRGGGGMGGMGGGINPMMMQQFQAMQAAQQQGGMGGGMGGRSISPGGMGGQGGMQGGMQGMNPMMMQQMMQQQQVANQQGGGHSAMSPTMGGPQQGMGQAVSPTAGRGPSPAQSARAPSQQPSYSAYEQQQFEQQKYEQQAQAQQAPQGPAHHAGHNKNRQASQQPGGGPQPKTFTPHGQPTSWEGMYDDVPQPGQPNKKQRNSATPVAPNPNAPVGAPTGPKNAGKPGANYRGGGRGSRGGFHPYSR